MSDAIAQLGTPPTRAQQKVVDDALAAYDDALTRAAAARNR